MEPLRVGVIGCGNISDQYFKHAKHFPILNLAAVADLDLNAARAKAAAYGIPKTRSVDELYADDQIDLILNLTTPAAHVPVALHAVDAGKHTYSEKPLGLDRDMAADLLRRAENNGVRVGCAPDTFMGACVQTARKLIDDGAIGKPVAFAANMLCRGHEGWHPAPAFYYAPGGGPMFDMGPYYLTALLQLLGPLRRVSGHASIAIQNRTIGSGPNKGGKITATTPDHITGTLEFASGCSGTLMTSFATAHPAGDAQSPIVVWGDAGTLRIGDPNAFDDKVFLAKVGESHFTEVPPMFPTGYGRAVGLADMALAIRENRPHRASGEQAFAVLDAMQGFLDSSATGTMHATAPGYERPAPMPTDPL